MRAEPVAFSACLAVALAAAAHAASYTAADYVTDGITMFLDGLENVALGSPHDSAATTWVDLSGNGFNWTISSSAATWYEKGLHFKGSGIAGSTSKSSTDFKYKTVTLEFVFANEAPTKAAMIFTPGFNDRSYLYTATDGKVGFYYYRGYPAGTATNAYSVVYSQDSSGVPNGVSSFSFNGLGVATQTMNDYWGASAPCLGNRAQNNLPAKGILMALRIYDRVLTDDERKQNAKVDMMRYCGMKGFDVIARADGDGYVSFDGEHWARAVTNNVERYTDVTVYAKNGETGTFMLWEPQHGAQLDTAKVKSTSFTVGVTVDNEFVAVFNPSTGGGDGRILRYSHDGLYAMWDGISNAGYNKPHDPTATNLWASLAGGCNLTLNPSCCTVVSNALKCLGKGNCGYNTSKSLTGYRTIEIVMNPPSSASEQLVFTAGSTARLIATGAGTAYLLQGSGAGWPFYQTGLEASTFAFTYSNSSSTVAAFYRGGVQSTVTGGSSSGWNSVDSGVRISSRNGGYNFSGRIYAIRLYNRMLTAVELGKHAAIDGVRFFGKEETTAGTVTVRGGGKVSVNGGTAASEQEIGVEYGETITLTPVPDDGMDFVAWETDGVALSGTNNLTSVLTLTYSAQLRRVTAVFVAKETAGSRPTDYVYDGLLGFWDGIANTGHGKAHDAAATAWKDLAGTRDLPLVTNNAAFGEMFLTCKSRSSGLCAGPATALSGVKTIEVLCDRNASAVALTTGCGSGLFFTSSRFEAASSMRLYVTTTNRATYALAYEPTRGGWVAFENGCETFSYNGSDNWTLTTAGVYLGGEPNYSASYLYSGRIYAVRAYNRALTPLELAHNADLDQKRFFGNTLVTGDRGIRVRDGVTECRLRLSSGKGGCIAVNGTRMTSGDVWLPYGTTVTLTAIADPIHDFARWLDVNRIAVLGEATAQGTVSFALTRKTEIGCIFSPLRTLRGAAASGYAQAGLVAHWDGLENVGAGRAHDSAATTWTDLSGHGRDWVLETVTNCSWTAKGLRLRGNGSRKAYAGKFVSGASGFASADVKTIECVFANPGLGTIFSPGVNGLFLYVDYQGHVGYYNYCGSAVTKGTTNTFCYSSISTAPSVWVNGAARLNDGMNDKWNAGASSLYLGGNADLPCASGDLLALRVYNRVLTDAERLSNAKLDRVRFCGEAVPTLPGISLVVR